MRTIHTHRLIDAENQSIRDAYGDAIACYKGGTHEIDDDSALVIASLWSSPGMVGAEMARLATTGEADIDALLDDCHDSRRYVDNPHPDEPNLIALDCLATWAMNHPSLVDLYEDTCEDPTCTCH